MFSIPQNPKNRINCFKKFCNEFFADACSIEESNFNVLFIEDAGLPLQNLVYLYND